MCAEEQGSLGQRNETSSRGELDARAQTPVAREVARQDRPISATEYAHRVRTIKAAIDKAQARTAKRARRAKAKHPGEPAPALEVAKTHMSPEENARATEALIDAIDRLNAKFSGKPRTCAGRRCRRARACVGSICVAEQLPSPSRPVERGASRIGRRLGRSSGGAGSMGFTGTAMGHPCDQRPDAAGSNP